MALALCYLVTLIFISYLLYSSWRFNTERNSISYRIHVNGIRGKSSVTRYVAAVLRDAGLVTYGKTTGTAARVILPNGQDMAVNRYGLANVNEQVQIIRSFAARGAQAVVMECMAINPDYQDWLENKVMHSHITIITNVRLDHQEQMGDTLTDIAHSMARSIPRNSYLITAEEQPDVLDIFAEECQRKGSQLVRAPLQQVSNDDLIKFEHMAHRGNIAVGLAVAQILNIPPDRAMRAMVASPPDPGAFRLENLHLYGFEIVWANLFAVNDKESFAEVATLLAHRFPDHYRIVLLNNRYDRPSRVEMFAELAQNEYQANAVVALGDYEDRVKEAVVKPGVRVVRMGNNSRYASWNGDKLLKKITSLSDRPRILLVGTVNIHTEQSVRILELISQITGDTSSTAEAPTYHLRMKHGRA